MRLLLLALAFIPRGVSARRHAALTFALAMPLVVSVATDGWLRHRGRAGGAPGDGRRDDAPPAV
jgi:hypothetical protein